MDPRIQRDTATSGTLVLRENPDADVPGCNADDEGENDRGLTATDTKTRSLKPGTACQIEFRLIHLISATSLPSGSGRRPIRFFGRSRMRSIRLERETPITSATVVIGNCPSAATAAAAAVFLTPWHVRAPP